MRRALSPFSRDLNDFGAISSCSVGTGGAAQGEEEGYLYHDPNSTSLGSPPPSIPPFRPPLE